MIELNEAARDRLGLNLGGTYSLVVDEKRERLFALFNAGPPGRRSGFGELVLVVLELG